MRKHWFKIFILSILLFFAIFFTILIIAPKQDLKRRGFIPCTEVLANDLLNCRQRKWCAVKVILSNNYCDMSVIVKGFDLWISGEQKTPWANYIFEPELYDDEELKQFYKDNPNLDSDMNELIELSTEYDK